MRTVGKPVTNDQHKDSRAATMLKSWHLTRAETVEVKQSNGSFTQRWLKKQPTLTFSSHPDIQPRQCRVNNGPHNHASHKFADRYLCRNKKGQTLTKTHGRRPLYPTNTFHPKGEDRPVSGTTWIYTFFISC